jgi:hypothetical protein
VNGADVSQIIARIDIYDVVGNVVVRDRHMTGFAKSLFYYWDGNNEHGSAVSQGVYLAVVKVTVTGISGEKIYKTKIGVKKNGK